MAIKVFKLDDYYLSELAKNYQSLPINYKALNYKLL